MDIFINKNQLRTSQFVHKWLKLINVAYIPGSENPVLKDFMHKLLNEFDSSQHTIQEEPDNQTDILLTTAEFGDVINWRRSLLFTGKIRYKLDQTPTVVTVVHAERDQINTLLDQLESALNKETLNPNDFQFPGLTDSASEVLIEQGKRGGPMMAVVRILQSQLKSIRVLLVVGDQTIEHAYLFDLVGAFPKIANIDEDEFYSDLTLRLITAASTTSVSQHQIVAPEISKAVWKSLKTPKAMRVAAQKFGSRNFFTEMVQIQKLTHVPALADAVSSQYSEGCFATWDPEINALIATVTGSARPIDKYNITENDLAVITGVRDDRSGAFTRHVEGKHNDPPSSEAVELFAMDEVLPRIYLELKKDSKNEVPIVRSKLHGHRGIRSFDRNLVEYVPMGPNYMALPVSCSTDAQANGIIQAFARSEAMNNPEDPRSIAFTILPGHGTVIVEKWVEAKQPFQLIWESMDNGLLEIDRHIPQGFLSYQPAGNGRMRLKEGNETIS